jgi:hypothetical protein
MVPISLRRLLDAFAECFTTPTFEVFQAMVIGLIAQTGQRTVCGMLTGAGLATSWSHHRAHRFFSTARWQVDQIGLTVPADAEGGPLVDLALAPPGLQTAMCVLRLDAVEQPVRALRAARSDP